MLLLRTLVDGTASLPILTLYIVDLLFLKYHSDLLAANLEEHTSLLEIRLKQQRLVILIK